jgi:hypothetical protein
VIQRVYSPDEALGPQIEEFDEEYRLHYRSLHFEIPEAIALPE